VLIGVSKEVLLLQKRRRRRRGLILEDEFEILARRPQYSSKIIGSQKTRRSDVGVSGCGAGVLAAVACSINHAQWSLSGGDHANPGLSSVIQTI
jgi:hypothetical protein